MKEQKNRFEENIEILRETSRKVIIFGTTAVGLMAHKVVKKLGNEVFCFCDNNKEKQGTSINGIAVENPDIIKSLDVKECIILVCAVRDKANEEISSQIKEMGDYLCFNKLFVEYCYQTVVLNRNMDNEKFEKALCTEKTGNPLYIENTVSMAITERCTLNCKNCISYTPYLNPKKDRDVDSILKALENLTNAVDFIQTVTIVGGEALLHPDAVYFCKEVGKNPKIGYIRLITNGNTKPDKELYKELRNCVSEVNLSDYGEVSKYKEQIKAVCEELDIIYTCKDYAAEKWLDLGGFENRNYDTETLKKIKKQCFFIYNCLSLKNSRLYYCGRTGLLSALCGMDEYESDFVDLSTDRADLREAIERFLGETEFLNTCNHCGVLEQKIVEAGVQAKGLLNLEEQYGKC